MALAIDLQERHVMHYVGVPLSARFREFGAPGGPNETVSRLFGWLGEREIAPLSGPLYIYRRIGDAEDPVDLTVAVPVAEPVEPSNRVVAGRLPAGRYLVGRHVGNPDRLFSAQAELLEWAREHQVTLAVDRTEDGDVWTARAEHFLTDPAAEPDASNWVTELLVLTA